jgi:hypothetical protein
MSGFDMPRSLFYHDRQLGNTVLGIQREFEKNSAIKPLPDRTRFLTVS